MSDNMFGFPGVPNLQDAPGLKTAALVIARARESAAAAAGHAPIQASEVCFTWMGGKNEVVPVAQLNLPENKGRCNTLHK